MVLPSGLDYSLSPRSCSSPCVRMFQVWVTDANKKNFMLYVSSEYIFIYAWFFLQWLFSYEHPASLVLLKPCLEWIPRDFQGTAKAQDPLLWDSCSHALVHIIITWRASYIPDLQARLPEFLIWWSGVQICLCLTFQVDVKALGLGFTLWEDRVHLLR